MCGDRDGALRPGAARVADSVSACLFAALAAAGCGIERPSEAVALEPEEYRLWEGDWYEASSGSVEDNVYFRLEISGADRHGFGYQLEERTVPYGPNAEWSGERTARFDNPLRATDPATGHVFSLSIDPADPYSRIIEVREGGRGTSEWSLDLGPDPAGSAFVLDGPTGGAGSGSLYRAGFDCELAATPVETTICGNEVLALGDLQMNVLYRELIESGDAERERSLRSGQREFVLRRDSECRTDDSRVDEGCVARLYSDRLVALRRPGDTSLGDGPRFDADFAKALLQNGTDLRRNTEARLAMYPLEMRVGETGETVAWQTDEGGVLYEQTYVDTKLVWPADVEIRYSDMLFVGSGGTVWAAAHMVPADSVQWTELQSEYQFDARRLELAAGRGFLTVWREGDEDQPDLVRAWLERHPRLLGSLNQS